MPVIQFGCPRCGATAQIDSSMIGRETQCPGCGNQVAVSAGPPVAAGPPPVVSGPPPRPGAPPRIGPGAPPIAAGSPPPVAGNRPSMPGGLPPVAVSIAPPRMPPVAAPMPGAPPVTSAPPPRAAAIPTAAIPTAGAPMGIVSNAAAPVDVPNLSTTAEPDASPVGPVARGRRPLRKLSPEEKAQRRLRRNIIMAAACLAILLIAMSLLIKIGG